MTPSGCHEKIVTALRRHGREARVEVYGKFRGAQRFGGNIVPSAELGEIGTENPNGIRVVGAEGVIVQKGLESGCVVIFDGGDQFVPIAELRTDEEFKGSLALRRK